MSLALSTLSPIRAIFTKFLFSAMLAFQRITPTCFKLAPQATNVEQSLGTFVTVSKAAETSSYTKQYIRYLIRQGKIKAERQVGIWLVDLESLQAYEQEMDEIGPQKYAPNPSQARS